jgi:hypothetical protein
MTPLLGGIRPRVNDPGFAYWVRINGLPDTPVVTVWAPNLGRYAYISQRQFFVGQIGPTLARRGKHLKLRRIAELAGYAGPSGALYALRRLRQLGVIGYRAKRGRRGWNYVWRPRGDPFRNVKNRNVQTFNPTGMRYGEKNGAWSVETGPGTVQGPTAGASPPGGRVDRASVNAELAARYRAALKARGYTLRSER